MTIHKTLNGSGINLRSRLFWHLLFWVFITFYLMIAFREKKDTFTGLLEYTLINLPAHIFFAYTLIYFLIPLFLLRKKYLHFTLLLIPTLFISIIYLLYILLLQCGCFGNLLNVNINLFGRALFATLNIGGIAVAIKLFKFWYQEREAKLEAEKSNLTSQLQLLKSQVHPHFLFNTLNNLYSLTLEKSEKSSEVVLKLSALLRYMLYECDVPAIALNKEIDAIKNYIDLENYRYGKRLELSINFSGDIDENEIAPLLLLPFIENCFKHGASEEVDLSWINLDLHVDGNILYLKLINSHSPIQNRHSNVEGIGLKNVKKRLDLLYNNLYVLKILPEQYTFTVSLELILYKETILTK